MSAQTGRAVVAAALALAAGACGARPASHGPESVAIPVAPLGTDAPAAARGDREAPPSSSVAKPSPFPKVAHTKLANGLDVDVVEAHALPLVQLRVFVRAGSGYGVPGAAEITAQLLKDGGTRTLTSAKLLERIEAMGSSLGIDTDFDATVLSMGVAADQLGDAVALLAEIVQAPRFDENELAKLKARETDAAEENARAEGTWSATRLMFRELFPAQSPYASFDLSPAQIAKVGAPTVRDFHRRFYVPKNAAVVVAGDVDPARANALVTKHFGGWKGGDAPAIDFPPPAAPAPHAKARVVIAHRPKSTQSDVFIVGLGPDRRSPDWPALRVAIEVLGGGRASRLFQDVRERRSLAYATRAQITELSHGAQPIVAYAGTETSKTALAVAGLLDNLEAAASISDAEAISARRFLSDVFALRMETVGAIADLVVTARALGLGDGYWDAYRHDVLAIDGARAASAAKASLHPRAALIVVAGDADAIAASLARFGDVTVTDPEKDFAARR